MPSACSATDYPSSFVANPILRADLFDPPLPINQPIKVDPSAYTRPRTAYLAVTKARQFREGDYVQPDDDPSERSICFVTGVDPNTGEMELEECSSGNSWDMCEQRFYVKAKHKPLTERQRQGRLLHETSDKIIHLTRLGIVFELSKILRKLQQKSIEIHEDFR